MADMRAEPVESVTLKSDAVELLYIWTECNESGFIRNQGFNFSPCYRFELKVNEAGNKYDLFCVVNENDPDIWKIGNIVNLTAVVGENGSGKSSLLRHLLCTPQQTKRSVKDKENEPGFLEIYRHGKEITMYHNFPEGEITDKTKLDIKEGLQIKDITQTRIYLSNSMDASTSIREAEDCIYFSPLENREMAHKFFYKAQAVSELSEWKPFIMLQRKVAQGRDYRDFDNFAVASYYHHLLSVEAKSETENVSTKPMVTCSQRITLWLGEHLEKLTVETHRHKYDDREFLAALMQNFESWNLKCLRDHPLRRIYWAFVFELVYIIRALYKSKMLDAEQIQFNDDCPEDCMQMLLNRYKSIEGHNQAVLKYYQDACKEIQELVTVCDNCRMVELVKKGRRHRGVEIDRDKDAEQYRKLCEYIHTWMRNTSFVLKYIDIEMLPRSSGEKALENIFTWLRLPPSFKDIFGRNSIQIKDNILLLLDEVDLYMHPDWQRQFLDLLYKRLNQEYSGKHIQVIISTHSPLVLSDIPTRNTIYLESNGEKCTIAKGPEMKESFGANLFALLKDSFFLKKTLGEFAYSQICEVIDDLNMLKKSPEDVELRKRCREYDKRISIIGEPMLKQRLQGLYREMFPVDAGSEHERLMEEFNRLRISNDPGEREKYRKLFETMRATFEKT